MNFSEYQSLTDETAIYPTIGHPVIYPALGLANEAGEVLGKIKKLFRDMDGIITSDEQQAIGKELGDVLWYVAQVASELQLNLSIIAEENLAKLKSRKERGVLKGSGDNR
jgi:NTP pyrophosphatase (non-canonical NTP hydrolase)